MPQPDPITGLKRCSRCKRDLPASSYQRHLATTYTLNGAVHDKPGLHSQCRECNTQSAREYRARIRRNRQQHPPITIERNAKTRSNRET
jgi:hypothetical protein